mmetsp:Transcript_35868/g.36323  ORF Transcript_35868/g.36323 Transcript_35868/m.36323 type:complete len:151 (-) Transcript_35868:85-537(-)
MISTPPTTITRQAATTVATCCFNRNYKHTHNRATIIQDHRRSFLRQYSNSLDIINEEQEPVQEQKHDQQQQQQQLEDENETETDSETDSDIDSETDSNSDSDDDSDDDSFPCLPSTTTILTGTDFWHSQRRMRKSKSVSSSLSSLYEFNE